MLLEVGLNVLESVEGGHLARLLRRRGRGLRLLLSLRLALRPSGRSLRALSLALVISESLFCDYLLVLPVVGWLL